MNQIYSCKEVVGEPKPKMTIGLEIPAKESWLHMNNTYNMMGDV